VSNQMIHISDWLPTLLHAAGGDTSVLQNVDGIDMWDVLSENSPSQRAEILHNIDNIWGSSSLMVEKWKLVVGTNYQGNWDGWFGPEGDRNISSYPINDLLTCKAARVLKGIQMLPTTNKML
jgi:arylsulfatase A-like enzyme